MVLDVSVTYPAQVKCLPSAAKEQLFHIKAVETTKREKYAEALTLRGVDFKTIGFETSGATGKETRDFWDELREHLQMVAVDGKFPQSHYTKDYVTYMQQRCAVVLLTQTYTALHRRVTKLLGDKSSQ
jgi:hypothetical protein